MTERDTTTERGDGDQNGRHAADGAASQNRDQPGPDLLPPTVGGESVLAPRPELSVASENPTAMAEVDDESAPVAGAGLTAPAGRARIGDRVMRMTAFGSGGFVIALVVLVAVFLILQAVPALQADQVNFITSREWSVSGGSLRFGIAGLLWATVIISIVAMVIAVPISIGIALFMTQYAPQRFSRPVAYIIDLLAAIPSIIYGIWGITVLAPKLKVIQDGLYHLGGFPLFKDQNFDTGSIFDGAIVLAIMILPIVTAIARDVFERTPRQNIEAAWALGATRWEMIRMAVLPYGRAGVVSGAMLGLGRALGETIAILLIVSAPSQGSPFHVSIFDGGQTFASKIAGDSAEFPGNPGPYIAAGLVLFVLTFIVNAAARAIVNRKKEFTA